MSAYIARRLLLMIPPLLGILFVSFFVVQRAPGQVGAGGDAINSKYRGAQGLDPDFIKKLEKQFGFDKPAPERFALMVWNFARFDFGNSYFRDVSVIQLVKEKLPVSLLFGFWLFLLFYLISILLGF